MTMNKKHPYLDHLETQHKKGTISRREFIRLAACLGVGAGVGLTMPGLVKPALASRPQTPVVCSRWRPRCRKLPTRPSSAGSCPAISSAKWPNT